MGRPRAWGELEGRDPAGIQASAEDYYPCLFLPPVPSNVETGAEASSLPPLAAGWLASHLPYPKPKMTHIRIKPVPEHSCTWLSNIPVWPLILTGRFWGGEGGGRPLWGLAGEPEIVNSVSRVFLHQLQLQGDFWAAGTCCEVAPEFLCRCFAVGFAAQAGGLRCPQDVLMRRESLPFCCCTHSDPASLKALLNFLLLQSPRLASFPVIRGVFLIRERLIGLKICLYGNERCLSTCWEADIE